ncbi:MAG TPA: S-layer homology domain-containing protein, partial [Thermoanaerobaculia bacterium]|nr:S-layer homology domain-containing protein [Thermoanaerobaculia bacterium]
MTRSRFVPALGVLALGIASVVSAQSFQHAGPVLPRASAAAPDGGLPPCGPTSITQSSSQTVTPGSVACNTGSPNFYTTENSYWRAFTLTDSGINGAYAICAVSIGVEVAVANSGGGGTQPLDVRLYTSDTAFPGGTLTQIGTASIGVADQNGTILVIPVAAQAPAGSELVVEIHIPDGTTAGNEFFIGSNAALQTGTSYISAGSCGVTTPTPTGDIGAPDMHIVMNVIGQELNATPAALAVDTTGAGNQNGVLEIGETATIQPSWTNATANTFVLDGTVTEFSGAAGPFYVVDDGNASYGVLAGGATADCTSATADCFAVHISGARPAQHFDAQLTEQPTPSLLTAPVPILPAKVWTLHVGESFEDVPTDYQFYRFIETIFHNGITGGCAGGADYCPDNNVTRAQMAVFLLKSKYGSAYAPPGCTGTIFTDVPCTGGIFDPWIEDLYAKSITGGCGGGLYCPGDPVTRAQMAVFLLKTEHGPGVKLPACTGTIFLDVTCSGIFDQWI